ncbi:peptide ABC transporter permease [Enterococcus sp. JM4C]|uniref:FtsX-like permease family protein n=1 Tax=Candidatus Enterococcus huntleyi TaxID=1857217 RepID=UPI001379575F|nr:ABC transporter permease [Enterococcus sp. JM4C]KAF1295631.1 peptide ABC transporter permease [Enterococcus sp. JM4C]
MNFNQFVVRNTLRNKHLYMAYFLSTLMSVMVFFTFTVFAFHPDLTSGLNKNVQIGMLAAAIIIYGFAFFFVLYSMDVFLQSRKKEFGLLMIQGMSPKQLKKMVFIENLVIGFFATISGSVLGIGFSQIILWISKQFMHVAYGFYFPTQAIILTILSFLILFLLISFFIQFRLPRLTLQELLKAGDLGKGTIKASRIKSFLSILLLAIGYSIALLAPGLSVPLVMLPVIAIVVVGTRFFFNQLSVLLIEGLKNRQSIFWKRTNMVVFSDLAFRMKDNARSFFLVSIISTVAFAAIGTLFGFQNLIMEQTNGIAYEFQAQGAPQEMVAIEASINQTLAKEKMTADSVTISIYTDENNQQFISQKEYNQLAKLANEATVPVTENSAVELLSNTAIGTSKTQVKSVTVGDQTFPVDATLDTALVSAYQATFVVPDAVDLSAMSQTQIISWQPKSASREQLIAAGKTFETLPQYVFSKTYSQQSVTDMFKPVLFVGVFIGIVFFISAGSFLYFRLYSDMAMDVEKFKMIYKMGLAKSELKKMIYQQVGILFFTPIIVSVIHGAVALTAMYHIFNLGMQLTGWQVLGAFVVIQAVYYLIARTFYFKKVYQLVQA